VEEILSQLMEQEEDAIKQYKVLLGRSQGSTVRELIERVLAQKQFELETLKLLRTGNVPERFISFGSIIDDEVNFRESPSPSANVITVLQRGTPVILTERRGNWIGIQLYDGRSGWVFRDYVRSGE